MNVCVGLMRRDLCPASEMGVEVSICRVLRSGRIIPACEAGVGSSFLRDDRCFVMRRIVSMTETKMGRGAAFLCTALCDASAAFVSRFRVHRLVPAPRNDRYFFPAPIF